MTHRRAFLAALAAALAFRPVGALGQAPAKPPRIGWLTSSVLHTRNVEAFRREMQTLGYRDISLEVRAAEGKLDRLPVLAAALAALPLDVIVTDGGPAIVAAKGATSTIPIVIGAAAIDLVQQGVVASLARPGGNVTGFLISTGVELDGKRLELLREALPSLARVAVVWNPRNDANTNKLASLEAPARALGVQLESVQARDVQDIERALGGGGRRRMDAMLALADAFLWSQRERIVAGAALALRPVGVLGQATAKPPRIGWLTSSVLHTRNVEAFRREMQTLGYRDISLEVRAAEGQSLLVRAAHIIE